MKFLQAMSLVAIISLSGTAVPVYGQQEKGKPEKQEGKAEPQRSQSPAQHAQPPQQQQRAQEPQRQASPQRQQQEQRAQEPQKNAQPQQRPPQAQQAKQPPQQTKPQQAPERRAQQPQPPTQEQHARPQTQQRAQIPKPSPQGAPAAQARNYTPPQRTEQQAKTWQKQSGWQQKGGWQGQATFEQDRSQNWQRDHRTWAQRGGYGGYYIPQDQFALSFGIGHGFRIQSQPIIVAGYPRFQYGGFSFMMVDPWPEQWSNNWYASDDVYIDYNDGYYLYDRRYPGTAIAITVVL